MEKTYLRLSVETVTKFCNEAVDILNKINNIENNWVFYWFITQAVEDCLNCIKSKRIGEAKYQFDALLDFLKYEVGRNTH